MRGCVYGFVCVYVCMYVCMYVCVYIYIIHRRIHTCTRVCTFFVPNVYSPWIIPSGAVCWLMYVSLLLKGISDVSGDCFRCLWWPRRCRQSAGICLQSAVGMCIPSEWGLFSRESMLRKGIARTRKSKASSWYSERPFAQVILQVVVAESS